MAALLCSALLFPPWHWLSVYAYEKVGHYQNKAMPPNIYYCITADYNNVSFNLETSHLLYAISKIVYVVILIQVLFVDVYVAIFLSLSFIVLAFVLHSKLDLVDYIWTGGNNHKSPNLLQMWAVIQWFQNEKMH